MNFGEIVGLDENENVTACPRRGSVSSSLGSAAATT